MRRRVDFKGSKGRLEREEGGGPEVGPAAARKVVSPKGSIQWECGAGRGSSGCQRRVRRSSKRRSWSVMGMRSMRMEGFVCCCCSYRKDTFSTEVSTRN